MWGLLRLTCGRAELSTRDAPSCIMSRVTSRCMTVTRHPLCYRLFLSFDSLCAQYGVHKVETAGACGDHVHQGWLPYKCNTVYCTSSTLLCWPHWGLNIAATTRKRRAQCGRQVSGTNLLTHFAMHGHACSSTCMLARSQACCTAWRIHLVSWSGK